MIVKIAHRIILLFVTLIGVLVITFVLSRVLPGSPVEMMLGKRPTQAQIENARKELKLDRPIVIQLMHYTGDVLRGDLGVSLLTKHPVSEDLKEKFIATFELTTLAVFFVVLIGIPIGVYSAVRKDKFIDHTSRALSIATVALPIFLIGMVLQLLLFGQLGWLPLQGRIDSEILLDYPFAHITGIYLIDTLLAWELIAFWDTVRHLVLPVLTLTIGTLATVTRITRSLMIEALNEDYIRTAFAYGLPNKQIYFQYALKATLIPLMTVVGMTYGMLLGGAVVVEFVFDWPGLGGYVVKAILSNDFPAIMGTTLLLSSIYLFINLVIDFLYYLVDPRLRVS